MALTLEWGLLVVALLLFASALASKASSKFGVPSLVLFIGIGMLAGSEGVGGIHFSNASLARSVGTVALTLIIFSGGLDTKGSSIRNVWKPAAGLAVLGTAITAVLVGVFAHYALDWPLVEGMLLGAIVAPTDAAAVFGVLRSRAMTLRHRLDALLEVESGSNDPTAVFLTLGLTAAVVAGTTPSWTLLPHFALEMVIGALAGGLIGRGAAWLVNVLRVEFDGLLFAITIGTALLAYGGTALVHGNGFLGAYVAGLVLGRFNVIKRFTLTQFHDGLAWLMQIGMFLTLGLLVFPSELKPVTIAGSLVAIFLIFVARPAAVFITLAGSKRFDAADKLFISWAGLRGAVPIVLATIPLTSGSDMGRMLFNLVFFVVLVSVSVQGSTLRWVAERLGVVLPREPRTATAEIKDNLLELEIGTTSSAAGKQVVDLGLPATSLIVLLRRGNKTLIPGGGTVLESGDRILLATRKADMEDLKARFV